MSTAKPKASSVVVAETSDCTTGRSDTVCVTDELLQYNTDMSHTNHAILAFQSETNSRTFTSARDFLNEWQEVRQCRPILQPMRHSHISAQMAIHVLHLHGYLLMWCVEWTWFGECANRQIADSLLAATNTVTLTVSFSRNMQCEIIWGPNFRGMVWVVVDTSPNWYLRLNFIAKVWSRKYCQSSVVL